MKEQEGTAFHLLMNYGWIFLILIGGVSALSYFRVFSVGGGGSPTGAVVTYNTLNQALGYNWILIQAVIAIGVFCYFVFFHYKS